MAPEIIQNQRYDAKVGKLSEAFNCGTMWYLYNYTSLVFSG